MLKGEVKAPKNVEGFAEYADFLNRSLCKKVVMTLAYNSSARSHTGYLLQALKDAGVQLPADKKTKIVSAFGITIREAMKQLLPDVIAFKQWLNTCAVNMAKDESVKGNISWVTPSGFEVIQRKNKWNEIRLVTAFGKVELQISETLTVLPNKHGTCTMPNLVHSLDASILHLAFCDFEKPFALIHDSVMTTASDVDEAIASYKQSYVQHFSRESDEDFLQTVLQIFAPYQADKAVTPVGGKLVVEDVLNSQYFLA